MLKVEKSILLAYMIFFLPLTVSPTAYSKYIVPEENVFISSSGSLTIVSTDAYEFRFNRDSLQWNVTRNGFAESFLKYARWRLRFNGTSLGAESDEYNSTNGGRYWSNSTFNGGIFLNFTSTSNSKAPTVMEYFWFYPQYFLIQLKVADTVSSSVIYIEKSQYIDDSVSSIKIGDNANTNFVFWGYKRRYQAQEVADAEPPVFMYSNKTDEGLVIAPFKPNWTNHVTASYMTGSDFRFLYELMADTTNADDITIAENNWVEFDKVFFQFTSADINQAFKNYAALYSMMYPLRPFKGSQTYWLTWYAGNGEEQGESVTEENVLSNATWIKNNLSTYYGFDGVLIDAIITDEVGDWLNYSKTRFPSGIPAVVDKIHAMGLKAGLWIAPLMVEKDGWINRTHPEVIAKNKTAQPLFSQLYLGQVKHDIYYLNPFDPWVQSRLKWVNQNISSWGFDFVKMDFLAGVLYELYVQNKTRYMIMEQTFKAIIAGLDERIVLMTCQGGFYNPAMLVNYVDRIWLYGNDLWNNWTNLTLKYDVLTQLIPFIRHFNTTVDSDALGYLSNAPQIPLYVAKFYSTYATVGGSTFEIGEKLSTIDNDRLTIYKKHLPFVPKKWRPIEWSSITSARPPRIWLYNTTLDGTQYYYLALFNTENSSKLIAIDLSSYISHPTGTFLAMNQYNSSFLGEYESSFNIYLDPNQTMILTLTEKESDPKFLMRTDHTTVSTEFISASFSNMHLTITLQGGYETLTSMIIYSPKPPVYIQSNGSFVTRLPNISDFDSSMGYCWYYDSFDELLLVKVKHNSPVTITVAWVDDIPPTIWAVERSLSDPEYYQHVLVTANVTEQFSEVDTVILSYYDLEWHNVTMSLRSQGLYKAEIPPHGYGSAINYMVCGDDTWGNVATSDIFSYTIKDTHAPQIIWIRGNTPQYNESALIEANITEPEGASGVLNGILVYFDGSLWHNMTMFSEGGIYKGVIPAYPFNATVQYQIFTLDVAGNTVVSSSFSYTVVDDFSPNFTFIEQIPAMPNPDEPVIVRINITEPIMASGVARAILTYTSNGINWFSLEMTPNNDFYVAVIPQQAEGTHVEYYIVAFDNAGNNASTPIRNYVTKRGTMTTWSFPVLTLVGVSIALLIVAVLKLMLQKKKNH